MLVYPVAGALSHDNFRGPHGWEYLGDTFCVERRVLGSVISLDKSWGVVEASSKVWREGSGVLCLKRCWSP